MTLLFDEARGGLWRARWHRVVRRPAQPRDGGIGIRLTQFLPADFLKTRCGILPRLYPAPPERDLLRDQDASADGREPMRQ